MESTCVGVYFFIKLFNLGLQPYYKETPAQVFSGEYCEIFKNSFIALFTSTKFIKFSQKLGDVKFWIYF